MNVQDGPSTALWVVRQGDVWALVIAGINEYGGASLNGREGPSATPWVQAVVRLERGMSGWSSGDDR